MAIAYSKKPTTIYVVLTDLTFGNASGGVRYDLRTKLHNNLAVINFVEQSRHGKLKIIAHEFGHTLGLRDVYNDTELGNPPRGFSRNNYMDYIIDLEMFFKTQIETIIKNLQ